MCEERGGEEDMMGDCWVTSGKQEAEATLRSSSGALQLLLPPRNRLALSNAKVVCHVEEAAEAVQEEEEVGVEAAGDGED
ncbi:hypothetical protein O3P69_018145 [Scylla paramamosain]|uniref:Uncharacterized protein n=1 Tax=Scylla paramamosain TaxID=85552 RepID=A0AAW0TKZ9_SCYPA